MRTELKAKFIQHINARCNSEKGFTLVELLVVIVIIGILTAIALPTFLNETAKAKQTEGKQNVISVNKAQIARRAQEQTFTTSFDILAISSVTGATNVGSTTNYTYTLASTATDSATVTVQAKDGSIKGYSGAVTRMTNGAGQAVMPTVICEANAVGTTAPAAPLTPGGTTEPSCTGTTKKISI
jgi:type IV pilus assembly protein PilA